MGRYCRFVMFKENLDTAAALAILQRMLRCGKGTLAVAGNKDKRGVTSQHVTAYQARCQLIAPIAPQAFVLTEAWQANMGTEPYFLEKEMLLRVVGVLASACINSSTFCAKVLLARIFCASKSFCCAQPYKTWE